MDVKYTLRKVLLTYVALLFALGALRVELTIVLVLPIQELSGRHDHTVVALFVPAGPANVELLD